MAEKNQYQLPEEYNDRIINTDQYLNQRRESALNNSRERTQSYQKPTWWDDNKNGRWLDCISTATDNYGNVATGNGTFYSNPEKFGFRRLNDNEASLPGDVAQSYYIDEKGVAQIPDHGYIINEIGEDGKIKSVNYSNGSGEYHVGANNSWADNDNYIYGSEWQGDQSRDLIGKRRNYRYRYVGTPAEIQAIDAHNAAVRANNLKVYGNENGPQLIQAPIQQPAPVLPPNISSDTIFNQIAEQTQRERNSKR